MAEIQDPTRKQPAALLDVHSVADMLDCSPRHVFRLAEDKRLPQPVRIGRLVRWQRDRIQSWIEAGCPAGGDA